MRPSPTLLTALLPWLLLLGSCSSPPKPPTVDESKKRPVNAAAEVELQTCKNVLQNTRITLNEQSRTAKTATANLHELTLQVNELSGQAALVQQRPAAVVMPPSNGVYTVRFDYNSARLALPNDIAAALVDEALGAPLIVLRGRTDGHGDALGETRVSRARAAAVREYLVAAGVDPSHIRATYQPTGDHAADNATAEGRALNRRVEIEVYRALPVALNPAVVASQ